MCLCSLQPAMHPITTLPTGGRHNSPTWFQEFFGLCHHLQANLDDSISHWESLSEKSALVGFPFQSFESDIVSVGDYPFPQQVSFTESLFCRKGFSFATPLNHQVTS